MFLLPRRLAATALSHRTMVAMLATKADFDKALADAGSKLVASLVRRLAPALAAAQGHSPLAWP